MTNNKADIKLRPTRISDLDNLFQFQLDVIRFKDLPGHDNPFADSEANKIIFIALPVSTNTLVACDVPESTGRTSENKPGLTVCRYQPGKIEDDHA